MIDANTLASVLVFVDCRCQFPLRIDHERQVHFVVSGEFFRETAQRRRRDLRLVLEDVVAEIIAQLLGHGIEVAGDDCGVEGPVVHRQREVVPDHRNLVSAASLRYQGSSAAAVRTLQVFKHHQGNLRAFGRPQRGVDGLGRSQGSNQQECQS